jgi:hypothetical protein
VQGMIAQAPQDQVTDFIGKVAHLQDRYCP